MRNLNKGSLPTIVAVVVLLLIVGLGIVAYRGGKSEKKSDENAVAGAEKRIEFDLLEQNNSGQMGKVLISEEDGKAKITITMSGKKTAEPQPAHVHIGMCDKIGEIASELTNVVGGTSVTSYSLNFDGLVSHVLSFLPLSVNVHKSEAEPDVYVACGELPGETASEGINVNSSVSTLETVNLRYTQEGFIHKEITVQKGQKVRFINETKSPFSVASDPHPVHTNFPAFDQSKSVFSGQTIFEFNFNEAGDWAYHNHLDA